MISGVLLPSPAPPDGAKRPCYPHPCAPRPLPRVDDTLAELGYGLRPVLGAMRGLGRAYQEETAEPRLAQTRQ